jgi:hypothetical protein
VLSKKQKTRLYRADAFGIRYINVPELPDGIDDVVHFEEKDDQKLFRTDTSGAGQGANFHGIGSGKPDDKANIAMYFDEVDETLMKSVLNTENAPLVLAGVEYLIPIYKQVAKYKNIWSEPLTGNHEYEDLNTLYTQATAVVAPYFMERVNKAKQIYGNQSATALTSSVVEDVVPAAYYGRIGSLFVRRNEHLWGTFDEMKNELVIHDNREAQDEDLIDKAVMKTLLNGGEVYIVEKEAMPADSQLAAIMRY